MKTKKLILFTSAYPYGSGETFLETEIAYLSNAFDQILIVTNDIHSEESRTIPNNCKVIRQSDSISRKEKLKAIFLMYNSKVKAEKKIVRERYKLQLTKGIRNTMLISFYRAIQVKHFCNELIFAEENACDYTFYSYWSNDTAIGLALLKEKYPEVKTITRTHGWDLYFEVTQHKYQSFRYLLGEKLDAIYPISDRGVTYCNEDWKINGENVQLARLGVSDQVIKAEKSEVFTLVSCSNVIPLKRVELILESLKLVKKRLRWVHFGEGKGFEALMLEAKKLPSNVQVQFMGHVPNFVVIEWYKKNDASLFINVSTTEGIPVSIMEAMSFGVPTFATNVGGTSEIVNSSNGKRLSPTISAKELAVEIENFMSLSDEEQEEFRQNAFTTWKEKYNAKMNYTKFAEQISQFPS